MVNLSDFDKLLERVAGRLSESAQVTVRLQEELAQTKKQLDERALEKIRALKEKDRVIEELEREKMNLQKEKEVVESQLEEVYKKIRALFPDAENLERR